MNRILKDIRLYESEVENKAGNPLPSVIGGVFKVDKTINFIACRIARKLNELSYSYGEFDHVYINFTSFLKENELYLSHRNIDKTIKYIDYGVNPKKFNILTIDAKKAFIQEKIFEIFRAISAKEYLALIEETEQQLSKYGSHLKIHYKTKETKSYCITIFYQINPNDNSSKGIVEYLDKKTARKSEIAFPLSFYEDIYQLIDTISVKNGEITLKPKKSFRAAMYNARYKTPLEFNITALNGE